MNKNINRFFSRPAVVAMELFSSGWCNLSCKYCYITKMDFLKEVHSGIIEKIKDGSYIKELKEVVGTDLEALSHWGTEPSLTVKLFKKFYEDAIIEFPKLKDIKLSSNFMTSPDNLFQFVTNILPQTKQLNVDLQVSCDGPPFITDKNRVGGSTQTIINNCLRLTEMLNEVELKHKVSMHLKPTFGEDDIKLTSDYDKAKEYYLFFEDFMQKWTIANKNNRVIISKIVDPTIVVPGTYCVEDGKNFYKLMVNQQELKKLKWNYILPPESNYYHRLSSKINFFREYSTKQKMFTCSAGDSCFALGDVSGAFHMCHAFFYLDHPEYMAGVKKDMGGDQLADAISCGRMKNVQDTCIFNVNDELQTIKALYRARAYNDFVTHKISTSTALTLELAYAGQISSIYKNIEMAKMLSYVVQTTECPLNCLIITGSILTPTASLLRLFGNGAFELLLKQILKGHN